MLELKNVTRIYRTKAGETRALDNVSIVLPEKGMVFVLGKSGCGKSTLLNVCGGLDVPDEGEIFVKGRSTKEFTQTDLDSYRNTCVGFVFQEYNILSEFSVEDNIAIALELQGKQKDSAAIADILRQVELEDVAKRKPDTLSGGQKQRVAIARALVKNPEIIMADEPTGALDSATGKQVFDVLKKLSYDKLVLVVSHDREFAELYADRIIELKDGKVISDVVKTTETSEKTDEKLTFAGSDTVLIKKGAVLEKEDVEKLNAFLSASDCDVLLSKNGAEIEKYKKNANISTGGERFVFEEATAAPEVRTYTDDERKLIRSKLPLRRAIKIGASGMKIKPVRFAFTLLLAIITFTMFGMFSTIMFYDPRTVAIQSLKDTDEQYLNVAKTMVQDSYNYENGKLESHTTFSYAVNYSDNDIAALKEKYGDGVVPVYDLSSMTFNGYMTTGDNYFTLYNFVPAEQADVTYVSGRPPQTDSEIAISEYALDQIKEYKFNNVNSTDDIELKYNNFNFTVCGVYKIPLYSDKLLFDESMPVYSYSTPGDNFMLSGLVTRGFYDMIDAYYADEFGNYVPVAESYVNGIYASANAGSFVTSESAQINYISKSNIIKAVDAVTMDGSDATTLGDGIAVSFNLWYRIFAYDMQNKINEKGLDDEFSKQKDEYKYTISDKLFALQQSVTLYKNDTEKYTCKELMSDIMSFFNENGLVDRCDITFYDNQKNKIATRQVTALMAGRNCGFYDSVIADEELYSSVTDIAVENSNYFQNIVTDFDYEQGVYSNVLIPVAGNSARLSELVRGENVKSEGSVSYTIQNANYAAISSLNSTVALLSAIFLYAGIGVAVFAASLLFNFISVSIADKKREIGILRAVGAKSSDVFKIFLSESMLIVAVCSLASIIITAVISAVVNAKISATLGLTFSPFAFGILSVLMITGIAVITALISTILPVWFFSKKKPVDTIRNL